MNFQGRRMLRLAGMAALCWAAAAVAGGPGYVNSRGQWTAFKAERARQPIAALRLTNPGKNPGGLRYTLSFEDVTAATGVGFDDPVEGEARRQTLASVMDYLGVILDHQGRIDVFATMSQVDGTGAPAHGSPLFGEDPGYFGGFPFQHITEIADPCRPDNCGADLPDMTLEVDFGYAFNRHPARPEAGEYDLFSTLLREIVRGLGVISLSRADGSSVNGAQTLTRWDDMLYTGNGLKLWSADGSFNATPDALQGSAGGVVFQGPRATSRLGLTPLVNTPAAFAEGVSLAGWSEAISQVAARGAALAPGVQRRALALFELQALADLGYRLADSKRLLFPWISNNGGQFESVIVVNNFGATTANVRFTARREAANEDETTEFISIPPRGFLKRRAAVLFPGLGSGPGYAVEVESDSPNVRGRWVTNNLQALSGASPSQGVAVEAPFDLAAAGERAGEHVLFGYLPAIDGFISAPVIVNIGDRPIEVTLYIFNEAGEVLAEEDLGELAPFRPFARVTGSFVENPQGDLYAVASADEGGLLTGVAFVFNQPESETAIGNATSIAFTPPDQ